MKIDINYGNKLSLMESNYPGQFPEQMPIFLVCDWKEGRIYARTKEYNINGTTFDEFHDHERFFTLPPTVDAVELRDYVEEKILPVANYIQSVYKSEWDGNNYVASFAYGTDKDLVKIEELCKDAPCHNGGFMNAADYFVNGIEAVHVNMTDQAIYELAERLEVYARDDDDVLLYGIEEYINNLIDELNDEDIN